jgi:sulfide dehydrogenase cytochrome subunit
MHNKKLTAALVAGAVMASFSAVAGGPTDAAVVSNTCAGCHGTNGASAGPAPTIGGLPEMYIASTMAAYKDGTRYGTVMNRIAKGYDQGQFLDMGKHFAALPWVTGEQKVDAKLAEKGKTLHNANGCAGCHGANGISPMPTTPRLAGQYADYLAFQMADYKDPNTAIPAAAMIMRNMMANLSHEDIKALAHFYAGAK